MGDIDFLYNINHIDLPVDVSVRNFVYRIWVSDWEKSAPKEVSYFYTADSYCKLIFAFIKQKNGKCDFLSASIIGPTINFSHHRTNHSLTFIGVTLHPYSIPLLSGFDTRDLKDTSINLLDALGYDSNRLADQLQAATDTIQRVNIISDFLRQWFAGIKMGNEHNSIKHVAQNIYKTRGSVNINQLANDVGFSTKQFERRFSAIMGLNPKSYARVVRFESFITEFADHSSLTDTAYDLGYFDQAHFIHDVKNFTGMNPRKYLSVFNLGSL